MHVRCDYKLEISENWAPRQSKTWGSERREYNKWILQEFNEKPEKIVLCKQSEENSFKKMGKNNCVKYCIFD